MVDSDRISTTYNRLKRYWAAAYPASIERPTKTRIDHHVTDGRIQVSCRRNGIHVTTMAELLQLRITILAHLKSLLQSLLPDGFELPDIAMIHIVDDTKDHKSFLDRPEVESVMDSIQNDVWKALCTIGEKKHHLFKPDGYLDREATEAYLEKDQLFLRCFAFVLIWMCGKPPRSYQAIRLQYRPSGDEIRNWHIFSGLSALGWPKQTPQPGQPKLQHALLVLPTEVTHGLTIYLGIMRRIITSILRLLGQPSGVLATHIFVNSIPGPGCGESWTSSQFTYGFRSVLPPNLAFLDDRNLGDLFTSIVRRQIPELHSIIQRSTRSWATSALNTQGGHSEITATHNYGLDSDVYHYAFNMSSATVLCLVSTCQVWQALWELTRLDEDWVSKLFSAPAFVTQDKKVAAIHEAQTLVLSHYLLDYSHHLRRQEVTNILHDLRFLVGAPLPPTTVSYIRVTLSS